MRRIRRWAVLGLALGLTVAGVARAAEFTPTVEFGLSDTKVKANPELRMKVSQDQGEEELSHVTLSIPKGFNLPADEQIPDGDQLGVADLAIDFGPRCAGAPAGSVAAPFNDRRIIERDRTDDQADEGVHAVWVVDLRPVTAITLEVTGSVKTGWNLDGDIPSNQFTCPPLLFDATIFSKSATGGVPILTNPKKPGPKVFRATFTSQDSPAIAVIEQTIVITR